MNCLVIDDNEIARSTMKHLVKQHQGLTLAGECADATEAYRQIVQNQVDLLLLDIEMPGMSGIELVKNLGNYKPLIIFTTSIKEYAAEAFDLNVVDFITKPVSLIRFMQAIEKATELIQSKKQETRIENAEFIFIRDSNVIRRLKLDDILFAEAMGDYVKLYTQQKFYAVHTSLKSVEEKLPAAKFIRVHRSYIVQVNKIDTIRDGTLVINSKPVPVADTYRAALNRRMNVL